MPVPLDVAPGPVPASNPIIAVGIVLAAYAIGAVLARIREHHRQQQPGEHRGGVDDQRPDD